jgi:cell division protein FtsZ
VLQQGVQGITDLIYRPGLINLDFADVQTVMRDKGIAHIGIGIANSDGDDRAIEAVKSAMESPLLETTVSGATDIIVNFSGDVGIQEVYDAISYLTEVAGDGANIIFGNVESDIQDEQISITIIATGIRDKKAAPVQQTPVQETKPEPSYGGQPVGGSTEPVQDSTEGRQTQRFNNATYDDDVIVIPDFLKNRRR